jgi:4-alpha-glucanotransferase
MTGSESYDSCVSAGLRACGVDKLFLEIHDASFPAFYQVDSGRGTPYSEGAVKFLEQLAQFWGSPAYNWGPKA